MGCPSLTLEERYQFQTLLLSSLPMTEISAELGRDRTSLYDELKRCGKRRDYCPERAQQHREVTKQRSAANHPTKSARVVEEVKARLKQDWSPEQTQGRLELLGAPAMSVQGIYDLARREQCEQVLRRRQMRRHRARPAPHPWRGRARSIHLRAVEALDRSEIGHWETDTMIGKRRDVRRVLVSAERQSLYVVLRRLERVDAQVTAGHIARDLRDGGLPFQSVTSDRGPEFAALGDVMPDHAFVCDAHQPNQRGTNENLIGLLRQYLPKGKSLDNLTQRQLNKLQHKLNHRPRKSLGYLTPYEVMFNCPPTVGTRT
jgi:IS30 family transposase